MNINDQVKPGKLETVKSEDTLPAIEKNPLSNTWRVSLEHDISQSSVDHHYHSKGKIILCNWIVLEVTKILKTFDSSTYMRL